MSVSQFITYSISFHHFDDIFFSNEKLELCQNLVEKNSTGATVIHSKQSYSAAIKSTILS